VTGAEDLRTGDAWRFLILAFGFPWGMFAVMVAAPGLAEAFGPFGLTHPMFLLAVWAPAIAAVLLVLWRTGPEGLGRFARRLALWRIGGRWVLLVAFGVPLCFVAGAWVKGAPLLADTGGLGALVAATLAMAAIGPVEEIGWRGVLQPLAQRRMGPVVAALAVGVVWAIWHLPAFLLSGTPQSGWAFGPFLIGTVALGVIAGALLNAGRGSILWPALFHWQVNGPLWPDAQPWDAPFFTALAVVAVILMPRGAAVMRVVPPKVDKQFRSNREGGNHGERRQGQGPGG
jgi:membrane protease YdiL (CAAX protease family)